MKNSTNRMKWNLSATGWAFGAAVALLMPLGGCVGSELRDSCYAPSDNLDLAYEPGAVGCACKPQSAPACVADSAGREVALVCEHGHWQSVEDGPCAPPAPSFVACGARAGQTCSDTEYCAYVEGEYCGAADAESVCKPRPRVIDAVVDPVCGCDNTTYPTNLVAASKGVGVLHKGACQ